MSVFFVKCGIFYIPQWVKICIKDRKLMKVFNIRPKRASMLNKSVPVNVFYTTLTNGLNTHNLRSRCWKTQMTAQNRLGWLKVVQWQRVADDQMRRLTDAVIFFWRRMILKENATLLNRRALDGKAPHAVRMGFQIVQGTGNGWYSAVWQWRFCRERCGRDFWPAVLGQVKIFCKFVRIHMLFYYL